MDSLLSDSYSGFDIHNSLLSQFQKEREKNSLGDLWKDTTVYRVAFLGLFGTQIMSFSDILLAIGINGIP